MELVEKLKKLNIKHFTQIDPDKENTDELYELVGKSGTDAVIFAGSSGVTQANLFDTLKKSKKYIKQLRIVAPSDPDQLPPKLVDEILYSGLADGLFIYDVINSKDSEFITGRHQRWQKQFYLEGKLPPSKHEMNEIAYIPVTHNSTVRKIVPIDDNFSIEDVVSWACVGRSRHSIVYLETTGYDINRTGIEPATYIRKIRSRLAEIGYPDTYIISGGEIRSEEEARKRLEAGADAINVGNPLYFDDQKRGWEIYLATIRGAKPDIDIKYHEKLLQKQLYSVR